MTWYSLDVTLLAVLWMAASLLMVGMLTLAARWGVVPVLRAAARLRHGAARDARLAQLERELADLSAAVHRLESRRGTSSAA